MYRLVTIVSLATASSAAFFQDFLGSTANNEISTSRHAGSRFLLGTIPFPGGQMAQGEFKIDSSNIPRTVEGSIKFTQNFLTGENSRYTAHLKGSAMEGKDYYIGLADDCGGTNYKQLNNKITAPVFMLNGFYVMGTSNEFNVDLAGGKKGLNNYRVIVTSDTGVIIGCTTHKLAATIPTTPSVDEFALAQQAIDAQNALALAQTNLAQTNTLSTQLTTVQNNLNTLTGLRRKKRAVAAPTTCTGFGQTCDMLFAVVATEPVDFTTAIEYATALAGVDATSLAAACTTDEVANLKTKQTQMTETTATVETKKLAYEAEIVEVEAELAVIISTGSSVGITITTTTAAPEVEGSAEGSAEGSGDEGSGRSIEFVELESSPDAQTNMRKRREVISHSALRQVSDDGFVFDDSD